MAPTKTLKVIGLKSLQADLAAADRELPRELQKANKDVAKIVERESRREAESGTRQQSKAAAAIKAGATQTAATVSIDARGVPFALGAFLGAKKFRQFPDWVGSSWEPGGPGGPYRVNDAIRRQEDVIVEQYADIFDRLLHVEASVFSALGTQGDVTEF